MQGRTTLSARRMRRFFTELFGEFATAQRADVGIGPYRMRHEFAVSHRAEPRFYQLHWVPEYWLLSYSTRLNSPCENIRSNPSDRYR